MILPGEEALQQVLDAYRRGEYASAVQMAERVLLRQPDRVDFLVLLGGCYRKLGRVELAIRHYGRALCLEPGQAVIYNNLGNAWRDLEHFAAAIAHYKMAIELDGAFHVAMNNLAETLREQNQLEEAEYYGHQALALCPDFATAHWDMAMVYLGKGDYVRGFQAYEWRLRYRDDLVSKRDKPYWQGEDLQGRTLLLVTEQGFGDTIQFIRFLPLLLAKGIRVILEVQAPLKPLFLANNWPVTVRVRGEEIPPFDVWCSLLSLGLLLQINEQKIRMQHAYLRADAERVQRWRCRLPPTDKPRVGVVWAGSPTFKRDRWRSPRLASMLPILRVPGIQFIGLQVGDGRRDLQAVSPEGDFYDLGGEVQDFADTAALLQQLDLLICSDTAPAHLAGALDIPCWVLLPWAADWRWMMGTRQTIWYNSLTLYRQHRFGDWCEAVSELAQALHLWQQQWQKSA
ncbi:MAG: tetratricopeptide repeat protein [Magnetococcales bacterium]|nr:tetratricopeptide repeat protein [Magnetococcales bacterium]MBF0114556.1 tetratricopeptide repeat protein [Magnetococcales bacterium]